MKKKMKGSKKRTPGATHQAHQEIHNHVHVASPAESGNEADKALSKLKYSKYK